MRRKRQNVYRKCFYETDTRCNIFWAFANTDGGCILLGVKERDDHSLYVVGLKDAEKMKKDFWNMVNNRQKISVKAAKGDPRVLAVNSVVKIGYV